MVVFADKLHEEIQKIIPIKGVSITDPLDKSTWTFYPIGKPTDEQLAQIKQLIDSIVFISEEDHAKNMQCRGQLQNEDWKVLRFIENFFREAKSGQDLHKLSQDKDFQELLAKRQQLRDAVKPEYTIKARS